MISLFSIHGCVGVLALSISGYSKVEDHLVRNRRLELEGKSEDIRHGFRQVWATIVA